MATGQMSEVIHQIRKTVLLRDGAGLTDGQLLGCFLEYRDEAAFAALVRRHGPMVWGVCRRLLNHHDAEDAFQAAFLVLFRKASSIRPRERVANWLYGVAHRTALQARRTAARRKVREKQVTELPEPAAAEQDLRRDLQPLLDQELSHLPDAYREVIVLCGLEGKTRKEAARQLGLPEGTVGSRLARARTMLAKRLARHGLALSGGVLAAVLSQQVASGSAPPAPVPSTIQAASRLAAGQAAGGVSATVAALTEGVMKAMLLTKLESVVAVTLATAFLVGVGAGLLGFASAAGQQSEGKKADAVAPQKEPPKEKSAGGVILKGGSKYQNPEMEDLQGVWQMESLVGPHGKVPEERFEGDSLVIEGNKFVRKEGGKTFTEGRLAIDTTGKQKILVMISTDREAAVVWALYAVEGDKLKLCEELLGVGHPTEFEASATQSVVTYKRVRTAKKGKGSRVK
ncbi:MAG TPA: sigma-70 family RNA polymerase sigma factor [Gemmataceae bacterium]|nr:sigma-70 family RNA polymerase sigma factor [Gemmataceae bacterium]